MSASASGSRFDLREAVQRYLDEHPDAADSLIGIRQWWLPEALRGSSPAQIRCALADLIASGNVDCQSLPDGTELFFRSERTPRQDAG